MADPGTQSGTDENKGCWDHIGNFPRLRRACGSQMGREHWPPEGKMQYSACFPVDQLPHIMKLT